MIIISLVWGKAWSQKKIYLSRMASKGQSCDVTTHVISTALIGNVGLELNRCNDINYLI